MCCIVFFSNFIELDSLAVVGTWDGWWADWIKKIILLVKKSKKLIYVEREVWALRLKICTKNKVKI